MSTSETGHAKNVNNFESLITFCKGYGNDYNPGNPALSIANLEILHQQAQAALEDVITNERTFNSIVNKRMETFSLLKPFVTRIINALDATRATAETIKDARAIVRKLNGKRAGAQKEETKKAEDETPENDKTISVSQQSYDQKVEQYSRLVKLIQSESNYSPNETDLTVSANQAKLAEFRNANTEVRNAFANLSNSRIRRNNTLYNPLLGLVNTALDVKKYIKSIYNANSPQFMQVNSLQFKKQKS